MKRCYIVGAGSHGRVVAEVWRDQAPSICLYFLDDDPALWASSFSGVPVVGGVASISSLDPTEIEVVLGIGHNPRRLKLAADLEGRGLTWARVVHPSATVMLSAQIGEGTVVFPKAVVNSRARVGQHVIVNTGSIVEHDCILEDGSSLAPGVSMAGGVTIGRGAFVSAGVTLAPRVHVGPGAVIGAGATVVADIPSGVLAYGVPARVIRPLGADFDYRRLL